MESSLWVIAISTAIIAVVLLAMVAFLLMLGIKLWKDVKILSDNLGEKLLTVDKTCRQLLNLSSFETVEEQANTTTRMLPKVLRGFLFITAFCKNFQKRRSSC